MTTFIPLSESDCASTNTPYFFVFVDEFQKKHIGIGVATQYFGGSIEVEIFHSTSPYSNGYAEDIPQENIKLVSKEPFDVNAVKHSDFTPLNTKELPPKGLYYVLSPICDADVDCKDDGSLAAGTMTQSGSRVNFGVMSMCREPEEFPVEFDSFAELSALDDSESHFITHYLPFDWPEYP